MRGALSLPFACLLLLSACAIPEARLRTGLHNAGLSEAMAACMAERMVDRLSLGQLSRIGDLPRASSSLSVSEFLHRIRALGDAQILGVSSSSAALCGWGWGRTCSPGESGMTAWVAPRPPLQRPALPFVKAE